MPTTPLSLVDLILKAGNVGLLALAVIVLWKVLLKGMEQVMTQQWVPGAYYKDKVDECNRLRSENDAYRSITLRAVGVAETSVVKREA